MIYDLVLNKEYKSFKIGKKKIKQLAEYKAPIHWRHAIFHESSFYSWWFPQNCQTFYSRSPPSLFSIPEPPQNLELSKLDHNSVQMKVKRTNIWHIILHLITNVWHLVTNIWHLIISIWHLITNIWHLIINIWHMIDCIWLIFQFSSGNQVSMVASRNILSQR